MNPSDKMSVRGAAVESGMSAAWWRREIRLRRVPFYRVGRRILISRRDVQALLKAARVEPVDGGPPVAAVSPHAVHSQKC